MILPDIQHLPLGTDIPFYIEEARDYLELLLSLIDMLQIYEECFPDDFQRDQELDVPIFPGPDASYSQREEHFFHLVNEHYFPMPIDFLPDDLYGERHFARSIPIYSLGLELYDESLYVDLSLGWKLILYLLGVVEKEWYGFTEEQKSEKLFAVPILQDNVNMRLLFMQCEAQGGAIAFLACAVQMLQNETDSVWLNVTMNDPCDDACWTKADMDEIKEQYHLALDIREKALCFCEWLEEDPSKHFTQVVHLWNACTSEKTHRETGPRILEVPVGTFVDGVQFEELFGRHTAFHR